MVKGMIVNRRLVRAVNTNISTWLAEVAVKILCQHPSKTEGLVPKTLIFLQASELKESDAEFKRFKSDFLRIARNNRRRRDF